jgi:hypothetical protein
MDSETQTLLGHLHGISIEARKLFCVVVGQAYHGPMHPKAPGVTAPLEILEVCGLDVGEFYSLLTALKDAHLIEVSGTYPFEEIRLTTQSGVAEMVARRCKEAQVPLEEVLVALETRSLPQ